MIQAASTTTLVVSEPKQAVDLTAYTLQVNKFYVMTLECLLACFYELEEHIFSKLYHYKHLYHKHTTYLSDLPMSFINCNLFIPGIDEFKWVLSSMLRTFILVMLNYMHILLFHNFPVCEGVLITVMIFVFIFKHKCL